MLRFKYRKKDMIMNHKIGKDFKEAVLSSLEALW
jgi:hypothetical protein